MSTILSPTAPASGVIAINMIAGDVFTALAAAVVTSSAGATDTFFLLRGNTLMTISYPDLLAALGGTGIGVISAPRHMLTPAGNRIVLPTGASLAY